MMQLDAANLEVRMYKHLPSRIVYVRHPQCLHNIAHDDALKKGIENRKSPLTELGILQRDHTAQYLMHEFGLFDAVFSSTYERTHAIPIAIGQAESLVIHPLLDERSMGVWHKMPSAQVSAEFPQERSRLKELGYYHYTAPEGESCSDVEKRQLRFLNSSELFAGTETVLISGHGISGLCLKRVLLGSTIDEWHEWDRLRNASVTIYKKSTFGFECVLYNYVPWEGQVEDGGGFEA